MSWKESFRNGIQCFQAAQYEAAIANFTQAIQQNGQDGEYKLFDSRAAAYEKLDRYKDALRDAKLTIDAAPDKWHGYSRAARLFFTVRKLDSAIVMVEKALAKVNPTEMKRRDQLLELKNQIDAARKEATEHAWRNENQFKKLPAELIGEIFNILVTADSVMLVTLLHICRYWRELASGNPLLWDTLILSRHRPEHKARLWIKHSKGRIRHLSLRSNNQVANPLLVSHCLKGIKWDHLRICETVGWDYITFSQANDITYTLTNLERLEIDSQEYSYFPCKFPDIVQPNLQHLTLSRTHFCWEFLGSKVMNLKSFVSRHSQSSGSSVMALLSSNKSLESLIIEGHMHDRTSLLVEADLPQLDRIEFTYVPWASEFLTKVTLPSLKTLRINGIHSLDAGLRNLIRQGPTQLVDLSISSSPATSSTLVDLLCAAPSLRRLKLNGLSKVLPVLEALSTIVPSTPESENILKTTHNILCPLLTDLIVTECPDVRTGPLVRLVKLRLPQPILDDQTISPNSQTVVRFHAEPISLLKVDRCAGVDADWIPWFREHTQNFSCVYMTKKAASYKR